MRNRSVDRLSKLSNDLLKFLWESNPVESTLLGIDEYNSTFGDQSADAHSRQGKQLRDFLIDFQAGIDATALNPEQTIDYQLCMTLAQRGVVYSECQRHWQMDPGMYVSMAVWGCLIFLQRDNAPLDERLRTMLPRMREIPNLLATAKANISNPPFVFVDVALDIVAGGLAVFTDLIPGLADAHLSLRSEILAASKKAADALESFAQWLRFEILPKAHGDFAVGSYTYEQLLFSEHRLTYSAQDLVHLAYHALEEAEKEIKQVAASIDPSVGWKQLIEQLKNDHPPKELLLDAYSREIKAAKQFVIEHDLVTIPAGESLEVLLTPEIERPMVPYAACFPPAPFGKSKAGGFWVTPVNENGSDEMQKSQLLGHCSYSIPVIALHEAYPGHHLQLSKQIEVRSPLPKQTMSCLMLEGWALYCEQMMYEQGFYTDPRVRLFQLKDVIWRVVRVIIDVGLHTNGMTFDEAVRFLVDKACFEEINAISEIKRYTLTPTQPMTYQIGKMLVLDLRQRMQSLLGSDFDLKAFHDQFISYGSIPTPIISQHMLAHPAGRPRAVLRRTA